tara:strand:+ start:233 stop:658 length:426 start_codon:yes stop_codon:yes gene_type:complete
MVGKYKDVKEIRSRMEQERLYNECRAEVASLKKQLSSTNVVTREYKHERDELKKSNKRAKARIVTMTKKQEATKQAQKSGMWSAGAGTTVAILYEYWKVPGVGFPGGHEWKDFWEHEAVFGLLMFFATITYGALYRALHEG